MSSALDSFITNFVIPERQDRYLLLLGNKKRRQDGLWDLLHDGSHLDKRKFTPIKGDEFTRLIGHIDEQLRKLSVKGPAYFLSPDRHFDDQYQVLDSAFSHLEIDGDDLVIYFQHAKAGYYSNHEGEQYWFSAR